MILVRLGLTNLRSKPGKLKSKEPGIAGIFLSLNKVNYDKKIQI